MPALNFQKQFAPLVESGEKRQTIRAYRHDGRNPKVGDTIFLYTGMRTKGCRKLGEALCSHKAAIVISEEEVIINGEHLGAAASEREAVADGFPDFAAMRDWFAEVHGLPFFGLRIKWVFPSQSRPGREERA